MLMMMRGGATSSVRRGESVGEPVRPRCPVRRLLLRVILRRRLGIVRRYCIRRCYLLFTSSGDEEEKDDFILLLLSAAPMDRTCKLLIII